MPTKKDDKKLDIFKKAPDGTEAALIDLADICEREESTIRSFQVASWKRNENYFASIQNIFWSESLEDWVQVGDPSGLHASFSTDAETRDMTEDVYDYVINIFGGHGESIIAALSQSIPYVEAFPDDAENIEDLSIAKAKTKLGLIIQKHNKAKLRLFEILFRFFNQGLCCIYRYKDRDEKYGTVNLPKYKKVTNSYQTHICNTCGTELGNTKVGDEPPSKCTNENCGGQPIGLNPEEKEEMQLDGYEKFPKSKECWEVYGPINVKVPLYAREQKEFGYLRFSFDKNIAEIKDKYPAFRDDFTSDAQGSKERSARAPSSNAQNWWGLTEDTNLTNVVRIWFRPWQFELIGGDEKRDIIDWLKKEFPDGLHITIVQKKIVDGSKENMDDCWIVGKSGVSSYIHAKALGQDLVPIQDMKNQLVNLTIDTIEHGVPTLFGSTDYLDFDMFSKQETLPGTITPALAPPGKSLGEGFYEQKLATPSKEIEVFAARLDEDAQFVSHDYPSIYGGPSEGKSRTLGEYQQSGQRAMQSLSIAYEYLKDLWTRATALSVEKHIDEMKTYDYSANATLKKGKQFKTLKVNSDDVKTGGASYWECSEGFPISSDQKQQLLIKLLSLQIPEFMTVVSHPENVEQIAEALAFPELYMPGRDQKFKALVAIRKLLQSEPIEMSALDPMGNPIPGANPNYIPSVEPEPEIDDENLQITVFKDFMASEEGQDIKENNPAGYMNLKAYLVALQSLVAAKMQNQFQNSPPGQPAPSNMG